MSPAKSNVRAAQEKMDPLIGETCERVRPFFVPAIISRILSLAFRPFRCACLSVPAAQLQSDRSTNSGSVMNGGSNVRTVMPGTCLDILFASEKNANDANHY